jgi:short-subunit dehydrogenase involved in D-alanine esterification of teichoic acids
MLRPQVPIFSVEMKYCNQQKPNAKDTRQFAAKLRNRFPKLNVLVNNAGIQRVEDLKSGEMADAEAAIETNLLGPMRLTAALIVHLTEQPYAAILNVTSALAMLPAAMMASCCASKAAIHSYTQSLRYQLRNTPVQVIELVPPWVHSGNNDAWIRDSTGNWNATTQTITVKPHTVHPDRVGAKQLHYEHRLLRDTDAVGNIVAQTTYSAAPAYQQLSVKFNSSSNATMKVFAGFWGQNTDSWVQLDDFSVLQKVSKRAHASEDPECFQNCRKTNRMSWRVDTGLSAEGSSKLATSQRFRRLWSFSKTSVCP